MMDKKTLWKMFSLFVVLVTIFTSGCQANPPAASSTQAPAAATEASDAQPVSAESSSQAGQTVRIGVIEPMTGAQALTGENMKAGYQYAVDKINAEGGIKSLGGAKLEVVFGDHQGKQEIGISEAERLIQQEKVDVLAGAALSGVVVAATTVSERLQVPFVVDVPAAAAITERGFKWVFRTNINGRMYSSTLLDFMKAAGESGVDLKKVGVYYPDSESGKSFLGSAGDTITEAGYEVVFNQAYPTSMQDFTTMLTQLKVKEPDVVALNDTSVGQAVLAFQQMSNINLKPKMIIAADGTVELADWADGVGGLKDGFFMMVQWNNDLPGMTELADDFKAQTGKDLTGFATFGIQAVYTIAEALEKAGSAEPEALQKAFQDLHIEPGERLVMPWDCIDFDETGQNTCARNIVVQWQNGEKVTVFPDNVASGEPVLPFEYWQVK